MWQKVLDHVGFVPQQSADKIGDLSTDSRGFCLQVCTIDFLEIVSSVLIRSSVPGLGEKFCGVHRPCSVFIPHVCCKRVHLCQRAKVHLFWRGWMCNRTEVAPCYILCCSTSGKSLYYTSECFSRDKILIALIFRFNQSFKYEKLSWSVLVSCWLNTFRICSQGRRQGEVYWD